MLIFVFLRPVGRLDAIRVNPGLALASRQTAGALFALLPFFFFLRPSCVAGSRQLDKGYTARSAGPEEES